MLPILTLTPFRFNFDLLRETNYRSLIVTIVLYALVQAFIYYFLQTISIRNEIKNLIHSVVALYLLFPFRLFQNVPIFYKENLFYPAENPALTRNGEIQGYEVPRLSYLFDLESFKQFPHQLSLLSLLFGLLAFLIVLYLVASYYQSNIFLQSLKHRSLYLIISSFALIQGLTHSGLLSPLTQNYFYLRANDLNYRWYVMFLLPPNQGAVNADWPVWSAVEQFFWGPNTYAESLAPYTLKIRRPLGAFLINSFSYFINSYYVWLIFNSILWMIAIYSIYFLTNRHLGKKAAYLSGFLLATSPIYLLYYSSPWPYFLAVSSATIALRYFDEWILDNHSKRQKILFILLMALISLTYDQNALFLTMIIATWFMKRNLFKFVVFSSIFASSMPWFVVLIVGQLGGGVAFAGNSSYIFEGLSKLTNVVFSEPLNTIFKVTDSFANFIPNQFYTSSIVLFMLAILGLLTNLKNRVALLSLIYIFSMLLVYVFFDFTDSELALYPRIFGFTIVSWNILAAAGLVFLYNLIQIKSIKNTIIAIIFFIQIFYVNADLFGFPGAYERLQFGSNPPPVDWRNSDISKNGFLIEK